LYFSLYGTGQRYSRKSPCPVIIIIIIITCSGVARICCEEGQSWKLGHGALTADFRAGYSSCSMTNSFVTNAVLIKRDVDICIS